MADEEASSSSLDVLGTKPIADAALHVTKSVTGGLGAILGRLCLPMAEEVGLMLQDKVRGWRANKIIDLERNLAEKMASGKIANGHHAHPRIVHTIVENASWIDDAYVQEMWAGLLAASCTEAGDDDSNLIFTDLLSRMTRMQARVMKYACEKCEKIAIEKMLIVPSSAVLVSLNELMELAQEKDIQRLDRELDQLRSLGLIDSDAGIDARLVNYANLTPTPLAFHMYVRCHGSRQSPLEFFNLLPPQGAGAVSA